MSGALAIALLALQEGLRRRVLLIVGILTAVFGVLYWLLCERAFSEVRRFDTGGIDIEDQALVGGTLLGLAMFTTLFLGTVLGAFLTLGTVRGDAERGLLQPLVVRPVGRAELLLARWASAALVCAVYVTVVFLGAVVVTDRVGGWSPDRTLRPAVLLALAVVLVVALTVLGSTFLTTTANGIAVFMLFGGGIAAGLAGQIGEALDSATMKNVGTGGSWALPFQGLYQSGLDDLTSDTRGLTGVIIQLGPFGGAQQGGTPLILWSLVYLAVALAAAVLVFRRRDL